MLEETEVKQKRSRRTKTEMAEIRDGLLTITAEIEPATVRQVFYQATSRGLVGKTEQEYGGTVCRLLGELRRSGEMPFAWLADNSRWMRKPTSWETLGDWATNQAHFFRRALWADQPHYVEVWLEKDALSGVLYPVTSRWDVPLMVTKGYSSLSFLYSAAESIADQGKATTIYYLGDHDPTGVDIPRKTKQDLLQFLGEMGFCDGDGYRWNEDTDEWEEAFSFERLAVHPLQITRWNLPSRPTKKSDTRSKGFEGDSVELDSIAPDDLRGMVEQAIESHVDDDALEAHRLEERLMRESLASLPAMFQ